MLYELREYTVVPGRLPALIARFTDHTLELFAKHGFDVEFISHTEFGENSIGEVVYVVRWESYQQMQDGWAGFLADPEWQRVKADSEKDGPLNSAVRRRLLNTAPFEPRS
ncbi:NIPSNAP family protein [Pseudonocardia saturnea]